MTEIRLVTADFSPSDAANAAASRTHRGAASVYRVDPANLAVCATQISRLWIAHLGGYTPETAARKLHMGYLNNPAGPGAALLLMAGTESDPVGVQCLHPRRLHLGGKVLNAAAIADFAVAPEHRSLGPALMLIRATAALGNERFDTVYGLPNVSAAAVCRRGGLRQVGSSQRYVKVLRWQQVLARHMPAASASLLSLLTEPLRQLYEVARRHLNGPLLRGRVAAWNDPALDDVWGRRPPDLLLSERSGSMLAWRFADAPGTPWNLFIAGDSEGVPQGYVVWRLNDHAVELGDVFAATPHRHLTPLLLAFFRLASAEAASSVSVEFTGPPHLVDALRKAGMIPRGAPSPVFEVPPRDGAAAVADGQRWYLTRFDNDSD